MLRMLPFLLLLVLAVFCLVEAISSRPDSVRNLPKWAWIVLILFFPLLGSIAWLIVGRPAPAAPAPRSSFPQRSAPTRASNPDDDAEFLRTVRERAEEQRRKHAEEKKREQEKDDDPDAG